MLKSQNRGGFLAAVAILSLLAGCDGKPEGTFNHSGGVVDGWPVWGQNPLGQRFSANTQITPENVKHLKVAWTYRTGDLAKPGETALLAFEATPILANRTLYLCSPRNRIAALDPETGKEKWMRDLKPDTNGATVITCRGVSYWKDSQASGQQECSQRIFAATIDGKMWALDADTGKPCSGFGTNGRVDLHDRLGFIEKPGLYGVSSAPTIVGDKVITGSKIIDFHNVDMPGGVVRALDARTGKTVWAFTTAPPDQPSSDNNYPRSSPNIWAPMSVDAARKLIFLPTGTPQVDAVLGKGDWDYYGSSVVALNTDTGEPVWHYQFVHKDIW
ncbi:MAG TPA: PQQ-binding-like beta-propeller repeat protein, partial [Rhizomicrobium sp.]|nr:PQQ-binding-like beta-propeller repeat protein [Rhizomicrobium sp.]